MTNNTTALDHFNRLHGTAFDADTLGTAKWFLGQDVYCQGFSDGVCGIWLKIGDGSHTLIGYGYPDDAIQQAKFEISRLLQKAIDSIEWFKNKGKV